MKTTCKECTPNINSRNIINLNKDEIMLKYSSAFIFLTKRIMDTSRFVCLWCKNICIFKEILLREQNLESPVRNILAKIDKLFKYQFNKSILHL